MGALEVGVIQVRWYDIVEGIRGEGLLLGYRSKPLSFSATTVIARASIVCLLSVVGAGL